MHNGMIIEPARHGGFVVLRKPQTFEICELLFAGTMDGCLDFIRDKLGGSHTPGDDTCTRAA